MQSAKFAHPNPSFYLELKKRINAYFKDRNEELTGGSKLFIKATILFVVLIAIYTTLVFFTPESTALSLLLCVLLGASVSSIGFNVMHDGGHGSFSRYGWVNKLAANSAEVVGASHFMWNMKHNVLHHAYTNIDGIDDDIDARPFLRMAPTQEKYKMHKYQQYYFWALYSILYLYWVFFSDYQKYFRKKIGETPLKKMKSKDHIEFWVFKLLYYTLFIVIPIWQVGWKHWLVGFLVFTCVTGFILSIVFQLAHTVEDTVFPIPQGPQHTLDDEWAVHQLRTTADFATKSKWISWYVGGLNFQVEHHLFPRISHVHYPEINKIVKQACAEYNVTYIEYPNLAKAVESHVGFLKEMGQGEQHVA